jgi:hypothetical protein
MKAALVLIGFLVGCAAPSSTYEVGRREAVRLRKSYARWQDERPRKVDWMDVPADALSTEAKAAGFRSGGVDAQIVLLSTAEKEGLLFGSPSAQEREGLAKLGFVLEATVERDVHRFHIDAKKG